MNATIASLSSSGRRPPKLELEHGVDRVAQGGRAAVVQVWRGVRGHPETGHLERVQVRLVAGDVVAAHVRLGDVAASLEVLVDDAEHLEHVAADVGALVTGHAAVELEQFVAALLMHRDGALFPVQPPVEGAVGRDQGTQELGDRVLGVGARDPVGVEGFEQRGVSLVLVQLAEHVRPEARHFDR